MQRFFNKVPGERSTLDARLDFIDFMLKFIATSGSYSSFMSRARIKGIGSANLKDVGRRQQGMEGSRMGNLITAVM